MIQEHEIVLYQVEGTNICVNVVFKDETFWMTQKAMAELFDVNVPAISKHLSNIFEEGELFKEATVSKMEIVQMEGNRAVKRHVDFYNLDAIISVGYRVNSHKATQFRIWATGILKEYMTKGFAMDDDRLKQGKGRISKSAADSKAKSEYDVFNKKQKIVSDFDREIKKLYEKDGD